MASSEHSLLIAPPHTWVSRYRMPPNLITSGSTDGDHDVWITETRALRAVMRSQDSPRGVRAGYTEDEGGMGKGRQSWLEFRLD